MDLPDDDQLFLRDLVKISRQKLHHIAWVDRDGTERVTTVSHPDIVRINKLAQRLRISKIELMRQAAHIPVGKSPASSQSPSATLTPPAPDGPITA